MRPPRTNEYRYTGASSSTFGSHTTANSRPMTEKQRVAQAAMMRQNAIQYGNSRRSFNLKSAAQKSESQRPRSSHQTKERTQRNAKQGSISHSHSERIFFPGSTDNSSKRAQRPQTAKVHPTMNKHRSQNEVPTAEKFLTA